MLKMDQSDRHDSQKAIPPIGWALTNIICLATGSENGFVDTLDHPSYVQVVITLAENLLAWVDNVGWVKEKKDRSLCHKKELKFGKISTNYPNVLKTSVHSPQIPLSRY